MGIILPPVKEQNGRAVFPVQKKIAQKPRERRKFWGIQTNKQTKATSMADVLRVRERSW